MIHRCVALAGAAALISSPVSSGKEPPFQPVEKAVRERTGATVRWQQDAVAREEALAQVRALLKKPLTVNTAVQIALLNNRDLLATFDEVGVSTADLREAGLWKNPSIDLSIRFPNRGSVISDNEESAAFDILDLFMLPLRRRVAAEHLAAAQLRVAGEALSLIAEVKTTVYSLFADQALLEQRRTIAEIKAAAADLAKRQHEAGNITDVVLAERQAASQMARLEVMAMETLQREQREKLNRLLGLWGEDLGWKLAGGLPALPGSDVPLRGLETLAVAQRLDLAAAQADLAGLVRALGLTKSYRYLGALEFGVDSEREPEGVRITGPTMRLELPIFNQGQARVAKGEAELRRAERKVEGLVIDIRADVRSLHDKLGMLHKSAQLYESEVLPTRQTIAAGMQQEYNGMLVGNYELFAARVEQIEAEEKAIEMRRDYWLTRTELERAVGGNLQPRSSKTNAVK